MYYVFCQALPFKEKYVHCQDLYTFMFYSININNSNNNDNDDDDVDSDYHYYYCYGFLTRLYNTRRNKKKRISRKKKDFNLTSEIIKG